MEQSNDKDQKKKAVTEVNSFSIPNVFGEIKEKVSISINTPSKPSKAQIIKQAFNFHSQGNISEALKNYQYFVDQGFSDHRVFSNYGVILKNLGKLQEAEISTRKAIEINPNYADAHYNLGNILKDLGKLQEAEISTRKAIEINPNFTNAHLNLGNVLKDLGKLQEAEISTRKAIKLNPNYADAYSNLGLILDELGKLEESVFSFERAIKVNQNNINIRTNFSFILRDYIWSTQNNSSKRVRKIDELIQLENKKLKNKLEQCPFWFIDIPRTSSTSTQFMMWEQFGWPFGKQSKFVNGDLIHERSLVFPNHTPSIITKCYVGEKVWESLETFTIVRNPYMWCLSLWQLEINQDLKLKNKSFLQYLNILNENLKGDLKQRKIRQNTLRQTDYLLDQNGNLLVKKILKFEDRKNIKSYLESQGIAYNSQVHINKSKKYNHQINESEKKIIERIFYKDFEILGY